MPEQERDEKANGIVREAVAAFKAGNGTILDNVIRLSYLAGQEAEREACAEALALLDEAVECGMPYGPAWFGMVGWFSRVEEALAAITSRLVGKGEPRA